MHPLDLPSTSVNFCQLSVRPQELPLTVRASAGTSVNFAQHSIRLWELPSISVNFPYVSGKFHQLSVHPLELPSTSVNYPGALGILSNSVNFLWIRRPSVNFCQLSVRLWDLSSTFRASVELSVKFGGPSVRLRDLPSISVSFPCVCGTFCQFWSTLRASAVPSINFRHLSVFGGTFRHFPSTFHASVGCSVNFCQLLCICRTFRQFPTSFHASL